VTSGPKPIQSKPVILPRAGEWFIKGVFLALLSLFVFRLFPQIDVFVSDLFFTEQACPSGVEGKRCGRFNLIRDPYLKDLREVGLYLPRLLMLLVCLWLTWLLMFEPRKSTRHLYAPIIAIISGLLGPALITNGILKEFWGRPRPFQTVDFGGEHPFVSPGTISSYCETNCSFVSGEATAAFWMLVLILWFTAGRRRIWTIVFGVTALAISILRVAFGRHYFSDITMAGFVAFLTILFAIWLVQTPTVSRWIENLLQFSNRTAFRQHLKAR